MSLDPAAVDPPGISITCQRERISCQHQEEKTINWATPLRESEDRLYEIGLISGDGKAGNIVGSNAAVASGMPRISS